MDDRDISRRFSVALLRDDLSEAVAVYVERKYHAKMEQLEQACWEYIRDRMISPDDCRLLYVQSKPWPVAIVADGYPPQDLDLN